MRNITALIFCLVSLHLHAQQISNFSLINVVNDQKVSLDTYPSCEGLVLIFTSNACPYDDYYRNRVNKLSQAYQDRVPVLYVNAHAEPNESPENMAKKARQLNLT